MNSWQLLQQNKSFWCDNTVIRVDDILLLPDLFVEFSGDRPLRDEPSPIIVSELVSAFWNNTGSDMAAVDPDEVLMWRNIAIINCTINAMS